MATSEPHSKTDLAYEIVYNPSFVPVKSPHSAVKTQVEGSGTVTHQLRVGGFEYGTAQFYFLDENSRIVWDLVDGSRTVKDIVRIANATHEILKPEEVYGVLLFFVESGALKAENDPVVWKRVRVSSSFITQIAIVRDSTKIMGYIHKVLWPLLNPAAFWACMAITVVGILVYAPRFDSIFSDPRNFEVLGSTVVGFLFYNFVILGPVIVIHELFHGLTLWHYSGQSGEIGTGWFYFGPLFYVDVSNYWSLPRRQRLMTVWAANLSTILIGSLMVLSELLFKFSPSTTRALDVAAFWCFYGTMWNLAPPFETDGYYMLADLVRIPALRAEGFGYLKSVVLRLFGRPSQESEGLTERKKRILLGYSIFSIAALGYIGFRSLRFAAYMGADALTWGALISRGLSSGSLSAASIVVGLTSIGYFALTMSGYSVLVGNQVKKSLVRGLRFDAVHDRHLSVFAYVPPRTSTRAVKKFEARITKIARHATSTFALGETGPLLYANLHIGGASLPLSQIKQHLQRVENEFYKAYQNLLTSADYTSVKLSSSGRSQSLQALLWDMTKNIPPAARSEVRSRLKEILRQQERNSRYLLSSVFSTAWTLEIPPDRQQEMLETMLSGILVEDLSMTNLADETEVFKKNIIYGLDSIAELASKGPEQRDQILASPEKFQLVSLFEPIRGRIIFLGRTELIEKSLKEFGSLFVIQVWSGFLDNLLAEVNLNLYSSVQSLPAIPVDMSVLRDGEVAALRRYCSSIISLEALAADALAKNRQNIHPSSDRLRELKALARLEGMPRTGPFDSILALNLENLRSLPTRLKDSANLLNKGFGWVKALSETVNIEQANRESAQMTKKKRMVGAYAPVALGSALLAITGLLPGGPSRPGLLGAALFLQIAYLAAYNFLRRSASRAPRNPSAAFIQMLTPLYSISQTLAGLISQANLLSPRDILQKKES